MTTIRVRLAQPASIRVQIRPSTIRLRTGVLVGAPGGGGGGVTDHGALTGLGGDDHPQYHTNARGDARYSLLAHTHPEYDRYVHTQASPLVEWTINHNLDRLGVEVVIRDNNGWIILADVIETGVNQVKVIFATPQTGKAYIR